MLTGFRARPAAYEHENLDYLTSGFIPTIAVRWLRSFLIAAIAFALPSITIAQSSIPTPLLFSGNTTVVAPPLANTFYGGGPGQFALLARMSDCSMFAVLAEVGHGSPPFTVQLIQADYQDNLHDLAGLTTRADQFSGGCPNPTGGNPAYLLYAYGGRTTSGIQIFVMADMSQPGTIDVYNATLSPMNQQVSMVQTFSVSLPNVQAIAAADLNGDGVQDLVISATSMPSSPGQILVFLGNGDGTFQSTPAFTYNTPSNVSYFSLADLNNDGKLDLVSVLTPTGGSGNANLQVLFGQGNGQFTTGPSTPLTASGSTAYFLPVLLTDLNGDGHLDAVLTDGEVLLGDGTGHFTAGTPLNLSPNGGASWIAAGDFNGDHKVDLAITLDGSSNSVSVVGIFLGNGDGTFSPPTFYSGVPYGFTISTTDVDGDGNLDLVLGENGGGAFLPDPPTLFLAGGLQVLMGKGDGTFAGAAAYPVVTRSQSAFAIADVSGDGHPDIVSPNALLVGDGTGKFTTQSGSQFPGLGSASVTAIRIGDLNGDTIPDAVLATGTPGSGPFVSLGVGGGTFATGTFLSSVPNATDLQIADVNGDNIPDLLVLSNPSGDGTGIQLQVLLGHGDGTFGSPQMVTLPAGVAQSKGGACMSPI